MATALDLLMNTKEDVNLLSEESDICTIDAKTRGIFVPSTIVVGGVQSDKNAERIKFSCPKIVGDNLDLSKFSVRINFENVSSVDFNVSIKDQYICDDVAVDGENVTFSWLIGRNAARYMGTVRFIVCAVKTDSDSNISVEWNTAIAEVPVLEGIEIDQPQIGQEEKDVINQLLELTKNTSAEAVQNVNSAKEQAIKDIQSVSQPDTTLTIEGGLAEAKATGEAIGSLKEDISYLYDAASLGGVSCVKFTDYTILENCVKSIPISFKGIDDNKINGYYIWNSHNLANPNKRLIGKYTLDNGAILTVLDDYTFKYDGTNATQPINKEDVDYHNNEIVYYGNAEVTVIAEVLESTGNDIVYLYSNDNGKMVITDITGNPHSFVGYVSRIWFELENYTDIFTFRVKINYSNNPFGYDSPKKRYITDKKFISTELLDGVNTIVPVMVSGVEPIESELKYFTNGEKVFGTINNALSKDNKIFIPNGIYADHIDNRNTPKWLYGASTVATILEDYAGDYDNPPIEIAYGEISNMSIKEYTKNALQAPYCIHLDSDELINKEVIFRNLDLYNVLAHGIGIGARYGAVIRIENCHIISENEGGLYLHNTAPQNNKPCRVEFINCIIESKSENPALKLQDWMGCCKVEFLFVNNTFISKGNTKVDIQYKNYNTPNESSEEFKNCFTLNNASHGNNVLFLNA